MFPLRFSFIFSGMKKFAILLLIFFFPHISFAEIYIGVILPNTANDPQDEYIEIINTGCEDRDLTGYLLFDASSRQFDFSGFLGSKETLHLPYSETKIQLNNSNETLTLLNAE